MVLATVLVRRKAKRNSFHEKMKHGRDSATRPTDGICKTILMNVLIVEHPSAYTDSSSSIGISEKFTHHPYKEGKVKGGIH